MTAFCRESGPEFKAGEPWVLGFLLVGGVIRVGVVKMHGSIQEDLTKYTDDVADSIWAMLKM